MPSYELLSRDNANVWYFYFMPNEATKRSPPFVLLSYNLIYFPTIYFPKFVSTNYFTGLNALFTYLNSIGQNKSIDLLLKSSLLCQQMFMIFQFASCCYALFDVPSTAHCSQKTASWPFEVISSKRSSSISSKKKLQHPSLNPLVCCNPMRVLSQGAVALWYKINVFLNKLLLLVPLLVLL